MNQKKLAGWLKCITIFVGIVGGIFFFVIAPLAGRSFVRNGPEFAYLYWPYLIWIWAAALPCYAALWQFWKICVHIGRDESFCWDNARSLSCISRLAMGDTAFCFVVTLTFFCLNMIHPGLVILMLFVLAAGVALAVLAAALSHLVEKACALQQDSELTI